MAKRRYTLTGVYKHVPFLQNYLDKQLVKYDNLPDDTIRKRLYNNLYQGYDTGIIGALQAINRVENAVINNKKEKRIDTDEYRQSYMDDLFAEYLQIPQKDRRGNTLYGKYYVEDSKYKPTKTKNNVQYKRLNYYGLLGSSRDGLHPDIQKLLVNRAINGSYATRQDPDSYTDRYIAYKTGIGKSNIPLKIGENEVVHIVPGLGDHTIGRGVDPKEGEYVSYYDLWDMSPGDKGGKDKSLGIGKPINFYDRIYLDDYYNIPQNKRYSLEDKNNGIYYGGYMPEVIIRPNK